MQTRVYGVALLVQLFSCFSFFFRFTVFFLFKYFFIFTFSRLVSGTVSCFSYLFHVSYLVFLDYWNVAPLSSELVCLWGRVWTCIQGLCHGCTIIICQQMLSSCCMDRSTPTHAYTSLDLRADGTATCWGTSKTNKQMDQEMSSQIVSFFFFLLSSFAVLLYFWFSLIFYSSASDSDFFH